jgi:microcystin-dependent protein
MPEVPAMPDDVLIGEIRMFGGNFAPQGFFFCSGQTLPINDYIPLFSVIGTTYGGDGISNFMLPDLRGRVPIHMGNNYALGQTGGLEQVSLLELNLPAHSHTVQASDTGGSDTPSGLAWGQVTTANVYADAVTFMQQMSNLGISVAGQGQPHDNMSPFLCVNFIIAWTGIFPSPPQPYEIPEEIA